MRVCGHVLAKLPIVSRMWTIEIKTCNLNSSNVVHVFFQQFSASHAAPSSFFLKLTPNPQSMGHSLQIEEACLLKRTVTGNRVSRLLKHWVEVMAKVKKAPAGGFETTQYEIRTTPKNNNFSFLF